ncbi:hypothetical protein ABSL23_02255 [Halobacterium sp. NMX12-1]|uniref:Uncharacterized protein n=1 Tax=Halobacterium sp. NMX12-1 TaxID=3166650 RepID=A0AAU8CD85_9EURY
MDRKKKMQMAWALLLGLLGLLAAGGLPSPPTSSPSPTTSPNTAPNTYANLDISAEEVRNHDEDETTETDPDSTPDPWVPPNEDDTGSGDNSPSPTGPGTGTGTGDEDSTGDGGPAPETPETPEDVDDGTDDGAPVDPIPDYVWDPTAPLDDLPDDGSSSDDGGSSNDGGATNNWGLIGDVDDLPGDGVGSGSLPAAFEDVTGDLANQFATTASILALPASSLYQKARDPVTDMGHETVEYAKANPGKAVIVVGAAALTGGAILVTASGWTVVGSGVSSSLAFVGVPRMQPDQARERFEDWTGINDSDSSASDPGETDNGTPLMGDGL